MAPNTNLVSAAGITPTSAAAAPVATPRFREAFECARAAIAAVPEASLLPINVDFTAAVTTALGAWPEMKALRPRIAAALPEFDLASFDQLETYAMAASHAHSLFVGTSAPSESLAALYEQVLATRELLHSDAMALARRGLLDATRVKELRSGLGYRNAAYDVIHLADLMHERWPTLVGKTALTLAELDAASALGEGMVTALGAKEQGPSVTSEAALMRNRAFTLFVRTYDQARRAIGYLRWDDDDVDTIAPSLYGGRTSNRKRAAAEEVTTTSDVAKMGEAKPVGAAKEPAASMTKPSINPDDDPFYPA